MDKKAVKMIKLSIVSLILVYLVACVCWLIIADPYTPKMNPNEHWICREPYIDVVDFDEALNRPWGQMVVDGRAIEIEPLFVYGGKLQLANWPRTGPSDVFMRGECVYHKDWFIVKITYDRDGLFEGINTITFRKEDTNNN